MNKISMTLLRTVFLPVGSPPIGSVCEITADIGKADIHVEEKQVYCLGEMDIIIDYLSFSPNSGRHLFPDHADTYPGGGGKEWQAMINLPFALNETADLDAKAEYSASLGDIKWFMVAPRALEMEMEIVITVEIPARVSDNIRLNNKQLLADKEHKKDGGWQMVSISDMGTDMVAENDNIATAAASQEGALAQSSAAVFTTTIATEEVEKVNVAVEQGYNQEKATAAEANTEITSPVTDNSVDNVGTAEVSAAPVDEDIAAAAEEVMGSEVAAEPAAIAEDVDGSDVIAESAAVMAEDYAAEPAETIPSEKVEPEIVKIIFNDGPQPDEKEIQKAIAQAKAEATAPAAPVVSVNDEESAPVSAEAENDEAAAVMVSAEDAVTQDNAEKPKKVRRSHGLPRLLVDAQNNNVEISAFNINIKLP